MGMQTTTQPARLPSRRSRKRGSGQVAIVRSASAGTRGPVMRSQTGQITIPLQQTGRLTWLWRGVPLITVAAGAGLYVGWRFSEQILDWFEVFFDLA